MPKTLLATLVIIALAGILGPPAIMLSATALAAFVAFTCLAAFAVVVLIAMRLFFEWLSDKLFVSYTALRKNKQNVAEQ